MLVERGIGNFDHMSDLAIDGVLLFKIGRCNTKPTARVQKLGARIRLHRICVVILSIVCYKYVNVWEYEEASKKQF